MLLSQIVIFGIIAAFAAGGLVTGYRTGNSKNRSLFLGIGAVWLFVTGLMLLGFRARQDGLDGIGYQLGLVWISAPFAVMYLLGAAIGFFWGSGKNK